MIHRARFEIIRFLGVTPDSVCTLKNPGPHWGYSFRSREVNSSAI